MTARASVAGIRARSGDRSTVAAHRLPRPEPSGVPMRVVCLPLRGQRRPCERSSRTCFPFNPWPERRRAPRMRVPRQRNSRARYHRAAEGPNRRAGWVPRAEVRRGFPPRPGGRRSEVSRDPTLAEVLSVQRLRSRPVVAPTRIPRAPAEEAFRDLSLLQPKPHIRSTSISASRQSASRSRLASRSAARSSGCACSSPAQASSAAHASGASNRPCT